MSKQPTLLLAEYLFFVYQSCYCFSGRCKNRQAEGFSNFQLLFCSSNCWSNFQLNSWVATWKKYGHLNANRYHCQVLLLSLVSSTSKTEKQFKKFTTECIFKVHFIMRVLQFVADTLNIPSFWTTPNFFQQQCKKHLFAQQRYRRATVLYLLLLKKSQLCSAASQTYGTTFWEVTRHPKEHIPRAKVVVSCLSGSFGIFTHSHYPSSLPRILHWPSCATPIQDVGSPRTCSTWVPPAPRFYFHFACGQWCQGQLQRKTGTAFTSCSVERQLF